MTSTTSESISSAMKEKWRNPEYRKSVKRGHDRYWNQELKRRLLEQMSKNNKEES